MHDISLGVRCNSFKTRMAFGEVPGWVKLGKYVANCAGVVAKLKHLLSVTGWRILKLTTWQSLYLSLAGTLTEYEWKWKTKTNLVCI